MGRQWKQWHFLFLGSKITADDDCSHELKRRLLLGRKVDITLPTKACLVNTMVFPVVMYWGKIWSKNKLNTEELMVINWCWRRLLRVPWTAGRSNQYILKEISPEYSLEGLMLKLNLQYFVHLVQRTDSFQKTLMLGKIEGRRRRGWQRMVGWHHRLDGHKFQ